MILAVDVHYSKNEATAGGVAFERWQDEQAQGEYVSSIEGAADYEPGQFFKRELPSILHLLAEHHLRPNCILVDGYVFLDGISEAGLGKHLYDALNGEAAVIGVAKKRYKELGSKYEITRGGSWRPLYITAAGIGLEEAKRNILTMHGRYRLPTMIKRADQLCRAGQGSQSPEKGAGVD